MLFPFRRIANTPSLYDLDYQDVEIPVVKGENIEQMQGWWIPAKAPNAPVMLYFHHNAANIGANVSQALQFHEMGLSVFLFDYRGFGQSEGDFPTEAQMYEDAQAAWRYLTEDLDIAPEDIVIYGHSVGGAVAIDLASKTPEAAGLIVQSSFTSMRDMTKRFGLYWVLPIELLLRQRFESLQKISSVEMPTLVVTGTNDIQIPVSMGERLCKATQSCEALVVIEGGGHDNHLSDLYRQDIQQFIERL